MTVLRHCKLLMDFSDHIMRTQDILQICIGKLDPYLEEIQLLEHPKRSNKACQNMCQVVIWRYTCGHEEREVYVTCNGPCFISGHEITQHVRRFWLCHRCFMAEVVRRHDGFGHPEGGDLNLRSWGWRGG